MGDIVIAHWYWSESICDNVVHARRHGIWVPQGSEPGSGVPQVLVVDLVSKLRVQPEAILRAVSRDRDCRSHSGCPAWHTGLVYSGNYFC